MSKTSVISTTITSGESSQKAIGNKTRLVLGRGRGLFREALISIGTSSAGHEKLGIYQRSRQSRSTRTTHTCCRRISGVDATADGSGVKQPINGDHALKGWYRPFADAAGRDDTAVSVMLLSRFPLPSIVRTRHASHTTCSWVEICVHLGRREGVLDNASPYLTGYLLSSWLAVSTNVLFRAV
jgi:hypothetical protein